MNRTEVGGGRLGGRVDWVLDIFLILLLMTQPCHLDHVLRNLLTDFHICPIFRVLASILPAKEGKRKHLQMQLLVLSRAVNNGSFGGKNLQCI